MLKPRVLAAAALAALIATLPAAAQKGADASGLWLTQTGDSKVRLSRCGAGDCGVIASTSGKGIDELRALVAEELPQPDIEVDVLVPYDRGDLVSRIHAEGEVLTTEHGEAGTRVRARVNGDLAGELAELG